MRPDGSGPSWPVGLTILSALRDPVIVIFSLAGTFDLLSGDRLIDGLTLFAVALVLGWGAARRPPASKAPTTPSPRARTLPRRSLPVILGGLLYAVLVGQFVRYSWPATIGVWAPAAAGVAIVWRRPVDDTDPMPVRAAGAAAWAVMFVALALWELAALLLQPSLTTDSWAHPTISVLLDPILATHLGRSIALSLWLASGWSLVRR